jgi:hypothetical protein
MPPPLPDCPRCDARQTLDPERVAMGGVIVAVCSCCAVVVRVSCGRVVHPCEPATDISGNMMGGL